MASRARGTSGPFTVTFALSLVLAFGERPRSQPDVQAFALQAGFAAEPPLEVPFGPKGEDSGRLSRTGRMLSEPVSNVQAGNVEVDHPDWLFMSEDHATKLATDRQKPIADSDGNVAVDVRTGGKFVAMRPQEPVSLVDRASAEVKVDPSLTYDKSTAYQAELVKYAKGIEDEHPNLVKNAQAAEAAGKAYGQALNNLNKEGLDKLWQASHDLRGSLEWRHDEHLKEVEAIIKQEEYKQEPLAVPQFNNKKEANSGESGLGPMPPHTDYEAWTHTPGPVDNYKVPDEPWTTDKGAGGSGGGDASNVKTPTQDGGTTKGPNGGVLIDQPVLAQIDKTTINDDDTAAGDTIKRIEVGGKTTKILITLNPGHGVEQIRFAPSSNILEHKSEEYLKTTFKSQVVTALKPEVTGNKWMAACIQASTALAATSGEVFYYTTDGGDNELTRLRNEKKKVGNVKFAYDNINRLDIKDWQVHIGSKTVAQLLNLRRQKLQALLSDTFKAALGTTHPIYWANKDTDKETGVYNAFPGGCLAFMPYDSENEAKAQVCSGETFKEDAAPGETLNYGDPAVKVMKDQEAEAIKKLADKDR